VLTSLTTTCKCHGVSGSCSVKTCWNTVEDLRTIGAGLMKSYYVALEVGLAGSEKGGTRGGVSTNVTKLEPVLRGKKHFTEDDLIYYTKSSDFCLPDRSLGSSGTRDRYLRHFLLSNVHIIANIYYHLLVHLQTSCQDCSRSVHKLFFLFFLFPLLNFERSEILLFLQNLPQNLNRACYPLFFIRKIKFIRLGVNII